jgi:glycosyltransferase involved in cell wall biosynthesis
MYCGNCLRDNALVRELRQLGHEVLMLPLYLPLTLDEKDESAGTPIFFSGISVYLEQQFPFLRHAPEWMDAWLSSRKLLKLASGRAAKTRAADLGPLTLSMLQGSAGRQARELRKLIHFLEQQPKPDVICLSNLLLTGMVQPLKAALGTAVTCMMQGEDSFLDALPESHRELCWNTMAENASKADLLLATSQYYANRMRDKLRLPESKVRVVHSGISLEGYEAVPAPTPDPPVLGFFARMCREKGLDTLVDAFIWLKKQGRVPRLRLKIGGSCGPADQPLVNAVQQRLRDEGLGADVEFHPNLDREAKIRFLRSLSVFSVPARYGEAFGLYLVEAMAAGVPVVQPRVAAFPELIETSGAGLLCPPDDPQALAEGIEQILLSADLADRLRAAGVRAARNCFSVQAMARQTLEYLGSVSAAANPDRSSAAALARPNPALEPAT